jgi:tetratricopeptide (TPR) repeat protein
VAGRYYAGAGEQDRLLFEAEGGGQREVTGQELGGLLAGKGVPAVVLNACQSGMTHPEAVYPSVGNQLLRAGVGGVVAMAYSVFVQTAVRFVARLYEGLLNGQELARAVAVARDELRTHPQRSSPRGPVALQDWVVPVLLEAQPVRLLDRPADGLRLNPDLLTDQQARAGAEVGCPEPPAFGFVGRDGVVLELERAFQSETVVLLQGMAGVGKTEAAVGFARWRAETGALDGPTFFFRFERHLPLSQVYDRVGQVFQHVIQQQLGREWHLLDAGQRREVALTVLRQVPCLLVWDNFEPVAGFPSGSPSVWTEEEQQQLRRFLGDLRGGQTRVLLTSRRDEPWLGPIYRRVELGGLRLAEAQELAVRVLRRAGLDEGRLAGLESYNDLLGYLRGNPLAILVILPELARKKPDELLQSLQTGEVHLGSDDPTQGRERSLAASLTYRLEGLSEQDRNRLAVLALFQGFVDADVLGWMSSREDLPELLRGVSRDDWVRLLDRAAEIGLLRQLGGGYYSVHPALPWFFHDLLQTAFPDQQDTLEQAFAETFGQYGAELHRLFNTRTDLAMRLLVAEEDNLLHALGLARKHQRWDAVAGALDGLNRLLTTQGRWVEWDRLLSAVEGEVIGTGGGPLAGRERLWITTLGLRAEIASYRRDFEQQEALTRQLEEHYAKSGDDQNQAVALHQLGVIAQERGRWDEAEGFYRRSLDIRERIGDEHGQAISLHNLGLIAQEQGNPAEALRLYQRAEALFERHHDPHRLEIVRESLQRLHGQTGQAQPPVPSSPPDDPERST